MPTCPHCSEWVLVDDSIQGAVVCPLCSGTFLPVSDPPAPPPIRRRESLSLPAETDDAVPWYLTFLRWMAYAQIVLAVVAGVPIAVLLLLTVIFSPLVLLCIVAVISSVSGSCLLLVITDIAADVRAIRSQRNH